MTWAALVPIVIQYGVPYAEKLFNLWQSNAVPSAQDWADLKAMSQQTAVSQLQAALARANIPLTDPHAAAMLAIAQAAAA